MILQPYGSYLAHPHPGSRARLQPLRCWLARAERSLAACPPAAEYCGEIISNKEMKQRGLASTSEYLFNVGGGLTIDASRFGNVTRYMNHSNQPNVRPPISAHHSQPIRQFLKYSQNYVTRMLTDNAARVWMCVLCCACAGPTAGC
jgi:hypothetical protein